VTSPESLFQSSVVETGKVWLAIRLFRWRQVVSDQWSLTVTKDVGRTSELWWKQNAGAKGTERQQHDE